MNIEELKRLALAAIEWGESIGEPEWHDVFALKAALHSEADGVFVAAANPQAILSLIEQVERLQSEVARLDASLDQELAARDRAQDALLEASMAMNGPEWCAKIPAEEPPNSGDLHLDVPELCRELMADNAALRAKLEDAQKDAAHKFDQIERLLQHCPDGECLTCGEIICPHGEPLHFHHDGCPACATECDCAAIQQGEKEPDK